LGNAPLLHAPGLVLVGIELADATQRLRFSHPEVHALVVTSLRDRVSSAGANIHMLAASAHPSSDCRI
jgi:benzoyl-CoA-dihydrodiol lyase